MKRYEKIIDGKTVIKTQKEIVIRKDGRVTYNPTEEMVLADGWVEYVAPEPQPIPEEVLIKRAKSRKVDEINEYDSSKEVNICYIKTSLDTIPYWANKTERSSLKSAIQDCIAMGRETYRLDLREVGVSVDINCEKLLSMLSALEVYAIDCYNKTTDHIYAVNNLTTVEEIEAYDYRVGYPEKLTFTLSLVE
jgi:hypothetical protein